MYEYTKKMQLLLAIVLLVFIDQLSKYIVRFRQPADGGFYICNTGVAFGIKLPEILILSSSIVLILFLSFLILNLKFKISNYFPLIFIFSGAVSNIIDRLYYGCVIDFIDLKIWPIFNLADSFIAIGAIMVLCQFKNSKIKKLFKN